MNNFHPKESFISTDKFFFGVVLPIIAISTILIMMYIVIPYWAESSYPGTIKKLNSINSCIGLYDFEHNNDMPTEGKLYDQFKQKFDEKVTRLKC